MVWQYGCGLCTSPKIIVSFSQNKTRLQCGMGHVEVNTFDVVEVNNFDVVSSESHFISSN